MTIFLVLDILLLMLIALFMPIGYWRGPVKELFVTLGVLFGILLADFWARPWGRDLADFSELNAGSGAFVVATAFLVASTFILGYGLGGTLWPAWHTPAARALGAAVAAFNGVLLLSFALQYVRLYLLSDSNEESLEDSFVSQFLLDQIGWVLLLAAFIAVPLLLFLLIDGRRAYAPDEEEYEEYAPVPARSVYTRARTTDAAPVANPPRVPGTPRDPQAPAYKAEPARAQRPVTAESRPLIVTEPRETAEPALPADEPHDPMGDTDPHMVLPALPPQDAPPEQPERDGLAPGYTRCATCHAVLAPDTTICPNCGTLR